ncbi:MAG: energy transducer TonB, partial [Arenicella sp.]|nr:energy transducer TonB [Arenicella sp.]
MYSLIHMDEPELSIRSTLPVIKLSNIPDEKADIPLVKRADPPIEVEPAPVISKAVEVFDIGEIETDLGGYYEPAASSGAPVMPMDNQLVIAIGFPPEYPRRALMRGVEGYAIVGFSVSAAGSVVAPYILESEPNKLFDRSSLKAISKFKYKARKVNGRAVSTDGQRYMFTYKLELE